MKAMILAAGRGERMRPLTNTTPKALLTVNGKPLIDYHIEALVVAGITDIVINYAYLGKQITTHVGNGERYGARIIYSPEQDFGMETGGGVLRALPKLGDAPFILINTDVWTDYPLAQLKHRPVKRAHLILTSNPDHHISGDFVLNSTGVVQQAGPGSRLTFAGISCLHPTLFAECKPGAFPLREPLKRAIDQGSVTGEHYHGVWVDVGTPERLYSINDHA